MAHFTEAVQSLASLMVARLIRCTRHPTRRCSRPTTLSHRPTVVSALLIGAHPRTTRPVPMVWPPHMQASSPEDYIRPSTTRHRFRSATTSRPASVTDTIGTNQSWRHNQFWGYMGQSMSWRYYILTETMFYNFILFKAPLPADEEHTQLTPTNSHNVRQILFLPLSWRWNWTMRIFILFEWYYNILFAKECMYLHLRS